MKKGLALAMVLAIVAAPCVFAAETSQISVTVAITQSVSVSVTPGSYAFGSGSEGASLETTGGTFTAVNDGNGLEDFSVSVADSTDWTAASSAGEDVFAMNTSLDDGSNWDLVAPAGSTLAAAIAPSGSESFDLQILLPTSTAQAGVEQTIAVTVTASAS